MLRAVAAARAHHAAVVALRMLQGKRVGMVQLRLGVRVLAHTGLPVMGENLVGGGEAGDAGTFFFFCR